MVGLVPYLAASMRADGLVVGPGREVPVFPWLSLSLGAMAGSRASSRATAPSLLNQAATCSAVRLFSSLNSGLRSERSSRAETWGGEQEVEQS